MSFALRDARQNEAALAAAALPAADPQPFDDLVAKEGVQLAAEESDFDEGVDPRLLSSETGAA